LEVDIWFYIFVEYIDPSFEDNIVGLWWRLEEEGKKEEGRTT
jgi:hypothetical protein